MSISYSFFLLLLLLVDFFISEDEGCEVFDLTGEEDMDVEEVVVVVGEEEMGEEVEVVEEVVNRDLEFFLTLFWLKMMIAYSYKIR